MRLKNTFSTFMRRDDLMPVIRQGIFIAFTGGLLAGALHLMVAYVFDLTLNWLMLFVLAYFISKRMLEQKSGHHIGFQILSIIFLWISFYIMSLTSMVGLLYVNRVSEMNLYLSILNPFQYFAFLNPFHAAFLTLTNVIDVIFFIAASIYAYRAVK